MLQTAPLLHIVAVDTAKNELSKVSQTQEVLALELLGLSGHALRLLLLRDAGTGKERGHPGAHALA